MNRIIDFFFDENEKDLIPMYITLIKIIAASLIISILTIIL